MRLLCADLLQRHPRRRFFRMGRGGNFRISTLASLGIIPVDTRNRNLLVLCLYLEKTRHKQRLTNGRGLLRCNYSSVL